MKRGAIVLGVLLATACGSSNSASPRDSGSPEADTGSAQDASADQTTDSAPDADSGGTSDAMADQAAEAAPDAGDAATDASDASTSAAAASCGAAQAAPASITYTGSTCTDGSDGITLSCNPGAHPEIVIRIDGTQGQVWSITPSAGLASGMYLGTSCSNPPNVCSSGSVDGGGSITDGPFPSTRTDYFMFETMAPTTCGPYSVTVALQ